MIWFCITLNQKLGKRQWASIAKTFHLPSQSTLSKNHSIGSNDPDSFLHGIVHGEKETFKLNNGTRLDKDFDEWLHHGCLSYDSAKCHDKVIYNFQTGELMGFAYDAFNINIIKRENGVTQQRQWKKARQPWQSPRETTTKRRLLQRRQHPSQRWQSTFSFSTSLHRNPRIERHRCALLGMA